MAINGVITSRLVGDQIVGDCYSGGALQYYCAHTENISAVSYKAARKQRIFVNGLHHDMGIALAGNTDTAGQSESVVLIPQSRSVRIGPTTTKSTTTPGTTKTGAASMATAGPGGGEL